MHVSEDSKPLKTQYYKVTDPNDLVNKTANYNEVCIIILPPVKLEERHKPIANIRDLFIDIAESLGPNSVLVTVGEIIDLVHVHDAVSSNLRYQHWISIKRSEILFDENRELLPHEHFGALIHTKYKSPLKHNKTRIAYSYCPVCDKTTKDYGGKKHTYHEVGTLISDIWRDISCDLESDIEPVVSRFSDLLGTSTHNEMLCLDCRSINFNRNSIFESKCDFDSKLVESKLDDFLVNRIIHGDVLEKLREIPENSIDFVFVDPPYNLNKNYLNYDDDKDIETYFQWCDEWLSELARVLKPGKTLALLNIPLSSIRHFLFLESKLLFQNWIVWDALSFPVRLIMPAHYAILCFTKKESQGLPGLIGETGDEYKLFINDYYNPLKPLADGFCIRTSCIKKRKKLKIDDRAPLTDLWCDIYRLKHNSYRVDHPCQLPPRLMHRLISIFTKPNEIVLDCFDGAGTTTLAAHQLGRRYIGIENSKEYYNLILKRHEEISKGIDPFRKEKRSLTSKNSPVPRMGGIKYKVPKKELQLEVKRVKEKIGHIPDRNELVKWGNYPIEYYDEYFASWGEVCAAARTTGMTEERQ
ncbi:site-specific DNA-methyltransferase [Methanosarcina sp. WWM596]|uniref:DNA-methyltransferase n=1 Tax=Methanosarcina sp. WWM596 TaxID=1434103 RepID=UPI000615AC8D|nr:site-specific DNA-methyltransferase [Methanosarcina sp. WWM596]AKB19047.1 Modification methylase MjaV [Methanosarcina sp. WWM596]